MSKLTAVLLSVLSLAFLQNLQACQMPFQSVSGFCLLINTTAAVSWCQAARLCQEVGGELAMDPAAIRAAGLSATGSTYLRSILLCGFVCQPMTIPNSGAFRKASFLKLGDITPYYCFTELPDVQPKLLCISLCTARWECRAALFNRAEARCRMLDFADASVGDAIEKSGAWEKFVKAH